MNEAAKAIFMFNTDEQVRKMCCDREEYYQDMRNYQREISDKELSIRSYKRTIAKQDEAIAGYEKELTDRNEAIAGYEKELTDREREIAERNRTISEKEEQIRQLLAENERLRSSALTNSQNN